MHAMTVKLGRNVWFMTIHNARHGARILRRIARQRGIAVSALDWSIDRLATR